MKKVRTTKNRKPRQTAKQRALLALLDELGRADHRPDQAFWAQFDRDLAANRLTLRAPLND